MSKKSSHIHRYEKSTLGKDYKIFKCNLPGCTHYISRKLAKNRISLCNRCNNPMVMDAFTMSFAKPHCADCTTTKSEKSESLKKLEQLVKAMDSGAKPIE